MKSFLLAGLILSSTVFSQTTVTVDAANVLRTLTGIENGINVNYLMDGSYLSPAVSPAQSLKSIKVRLLRYPGGEKSDNYLFSESPYNASSPRMALKGNCAWPTGDFEFVDTASAKKLNRPTALDFDEFIAMCNIAGAAPLVVVAYDAAYNTSACAIKPTKAALKTNAVEWVRYANKKKNYQVKYWMIGNESWNDPAYNGKVTASQYAKDVAEFAAAMKAVDNTIKIIVNGQSGWWQTLLKSSAVSYIDFLAFSEYPTYNYTGGYEYYRTHNVNLVPEVTAAINSITTYAPAAHQSRIKVIASEYNSIDWSDQWESINNLGHALVNFQMFGDMVVKPKVEAACMWGTRWIDNAKATGSLYDAFNADGGMNATGKAIKVWGDGLLKTMVYASSNSSYVKTYASYDGAAKKLNVFILNKDNVSKPVPVKINNFITNYNGSKWQFKGTSVSDKFPSFAKTDSIYAPSNLASLVVPANSVTLLMLQAPAPPPATAPLQILLVTPNPFSTSLTLKVTTNIARRIPVRVIDVNGKFVRYETRTLNAGLNTFTITNLGGLSKGVYLIRIGDATASATYTVVKG